MKVLVIVSCLLAAAAATPGLVSAPVAYASAPVAVAAAVTSQYHAQDELGQYSYGYQGDTSAKQEVRTIDGVTRGGYSYLDANGLVQSASYVSDPVNGFRVAATNLPVGPSAPAAPVAPVAAYAAPVAAYAAPAPVAAYAAPAPVAYAAPAVVGGPVVPADTPEVAAAKAAHFQAHAAARAAVLGRKKRSPGVVAYSAPALAYSAPALAYSAPALAYAAPAVVPARSFAYSTVSAHPTAVYAAAPAVYGPSVVVA